jgi:hypothetical protein
MPAEVPNVQSPPDKVSWEWLLRVPGLILGQLGYISVYGYPGVFLGAIVTLLGAYLGRPYGELPFWMFLGIAAYLPGLAYYLRPDKIVERNFKLWDRWVAQKIITGNQRKEWRKELHAWYIEQTFRSLPRDGKTPPLMSEPAVSAQISNKA